MSRRARLLCAVLSVCACVIPGVAADAQAPGSAATQPSGALPPDPTSTWTIQDENSSISSAHLTDRYYTNGLRLGWTSGSDAVPGFLSDADRAVWGDGRQRISFELNQSIFTPRDTEARNPPIGDRPYAGILTGNFSLINETPGSRSTVSVALGVIGPWALGEEVQNGFHDLIGQKHNNGWHYQLHNEPAVEFLTGRVWRLPVTSFGGLDVDALPEIDAGVGNVRVYADTGVRFRLGRGLTTDYGPARVRPGLSGGDAFVPVQPFAWYVFAGLDGQAVAHDVTLDGNSFRSSRSVHLKPLVGEGEVGLALIAFGARLTYTHVLQSQEFTGQKGGLHQFGSLALSVRF